MVSSPVGASDFVWLFFNVQISLQPFCFRYKEVKPKFCIGAEFSARSNMGKIKIELGRISFEFASLRQIQFV